jgi:hypothetical protein
MMTAAHEEPIDPATYVIYRVIQESLCTCKDTQNSPPTAQLVEEREWSSLCGHVTHSVTCSTYGMCVHRNFWIASHFQHMFLNESGTLNHSVKHLHVIGRTPTEATRLRFDQEKKLTTLNSGRVVIASWARWWDKRHYELKVWPESDCKVILFLDRIAVASSQWENGHKFLFWESGVTKWSFPRYRRISMRHTTSKADSRSIWRDLTFPGEGELVLLGVRCSVRVWRSISFVTLLQENVE